MKKPFLLLAGVMMLLPIKSVSTYAQDISSSLMSVPSTRLFGRILSRQHGNEKDTAIIMRSIVALFPENRFPEQILAGEPPAVFYDTVPRGYVAQNAAAYTLIEPPFGGYNFKDIPFGNYWFCKFDIDDDMDEEHILNKPDLMLSGCQYLIVDTTHPIQQNYYRDEVGFWFDDFSTEPAEEKQPPILLPVSSSEECTTQE